MAKSIVSLPVLCLLLLLSLNFCGLLKLVDGQGKTWCVAKPSTDDATLINNMNYACDELGKMQRNCKPIQQGGACYEPNTPMNHASVAMNMYYQANGRDHWECHFSGSGLTTISDPSYGSCQYE